MPFDRPVLCPIIVGRDGALDGLDRWLDQARDGTGRTVLVAGEAGIGKSRLVAEASARAAQRGFAILEGLCFEPDRSVPYAPLLDLLQTRFAARPAAEIAADLGPAAPALLRLLPQLAEALPTTGIAPIAEPERQRRHLIDALTRVAIGSAGDRPALVVVEDLHWSDDASLDLLLHLARRAADRPLLLLLTYRSDEVRPALAYLLAELDRRRLATEVRLDRLSEIEIDAMVRSIFDLGRPIRPEFLALLHELTDGNPFFVEEVLTALVAGGDVFYAEGTWNRKELESLQIPRSVQEAVRRRAAGLSEPARQALTLAAVAGRRFDVPLLHGLLGIDEERLLALLKELTAARLVVEESADRYAFRHALTRQAVYTDLLERERRVLHNRVAEILERLAGETRDAYLDDLAMHHFAAGNSAKALAYGHQAGERALAMHSPRAALDHLDRAIAAAAALGQAPSVALHRLRGQANETLGKFEPALTDHEAALAAARSAGQRTDEWQALLDLGFLWAARDYGRTGDLLRQALALARETGDPLILARSLNRLGNWHLNRGESAAACRHHEEALSVFEALGDRRGLAETLDLLGMAASHLGDFPRAADCLERAIDLCRGVDDRRALVSVLALLAMLGSGLPAGTEAPVISRHGSAVDLGEQAVEVARAIGWPAGEAYAMGSLGWCLMSRGEYARVLGVARASRAIAEEIGHREWLAATHHTLGALAVALFAFQAARRSLAQGFEVASEVGSGWWSHLNAAVLARACLLAGDHAAAEAALDHGAATGGSIPPILDRARRRVRAELALACGDPAGALAITEDLIATASNRSAAAIIPELWALRGKALIGLDRPAEAEATLLAAASAARGQHLRPLLWRIWVSLGGLYRDQTRDAEADRAFAAARAVAEELAANAPEGPVPELNLEAPRAHVLAAMTAPLPTPRPLTPLQAAKHAFDGLTAREREIATLIARGKSNRAIAAELSLSERTVATHVTNALAKLGFTSRAQLAAWTVEKGLTAPPH